MEFLAPAKVNLSLRVLRRREDGFHEIETMAPLSIFDTLEVERKESGGLQFTCSDPCLPTGGDNLVTKAVDEFCGSFGFQPHLRIHLRKEIPHGAGLGGGSSDAATTLIALNHLFQTDLPQEELIRLAAACVVPRAWGDRGAVQARPGDPASPGEAAVWRADPVGVQAVAAVAGDPGGDVRGAAASLG
jgi:hypothetical protein